MSTSDLSDFLNPTHAVYAAKIRDGMKIADLGVGAGFFARAAARLVGPSGIVYAVDIDRGLLQRLDSYAKAEGLSNLHYIQGDFDLPHGTSLPDGTLDVALVVNTLFQVVDKAQLVQEVWRILRPGGRVVVIDWSASFNHMGPHPDQVVTKEKAIDMFTRGGGFAHLEDIPAGSYHYGFILKRSK